MHGAGKTTILCNLFLKKDKQKIKELVKTIPSKLINKIAIGFNSEVLKIGGVTLTAYDLGGTERYFKILIQIVSLHIGMPTMMNQPRALFM